MPLIIVYKLNLIDTGKAKSPTVRDHDVTHLAFAVTCYIRNRNNCQYRYCTSAILTKIGIPRGGCPKLERNVPAYRPPHGDNGVCSSVCLTYAGHIMG